jgi:hypothetical protein
MIEGIPTPPPARPPKRDKGGGPKDPKRKDLAAELAVLRAEVDALKAAVASLARPPRPSAAPSPGDPSLPPADLLDRARAALGDTDVAVLFAVAGREDGEPVGVAGEVSGRESLLAVSDEQFARLGYAFASPPKAALLRALVLGGPQSAARLGPQAGISTGSLYHHLRELVHAGVIYPAPRRRYALTPLGRAATLLLFALASRPPQ